MDIGPAGLDDLLRAELADAQRRYAEGPSPESRADYRRLLRLFADLVVRGQQPPRPE